MCLWGLTSPKLIGQVAAWKSSGMNCCCGSEAQLGQGNTRFAFKVLQLLG